MKSLSRSPLGPEWITCRFCEALCLQRDLLPGQELRCSRCDSTVMVHIPERSFQPPFALSLTGLFVLILANCVPILNFEVVGKSQSDFMITGVIELWRQGYFFISLLVLFCAIIAPAVFLFCAFYLGFALALKMRPPGLALVSRIALAVRPWNLIPVYSIATVVAVVKLRMLGEVAWQPGARFVLGVAVMSVLCEQFSNRQIAYERLKELGVNIADNRTDGLSARSRVNLSRALVVTGLVLYIPSNIMPVMTMSIIGKVDPLTVLGGVHELYDSGLTLIAAVVFLASFILPLAKLVALAWVVFLHGSSKLRRERSKVFKIAHAIGSWSMIDIFLLAVLAAVGQLGALASVTAEPGCLVFALVLLCSLVAAEIYKPCLIWESM